MVWHKETSYDGSFDNKVCATTRIEQRTVGHEHCSLGRSHERRSILGLRHQSFRNLWHDPIDWKGENRMGHFLMALQTELTNTIRLLQLQSFTAFHITTKDVSNLKVVAKEILLKVPPVKLHPPPSKQPVIRKKSYLSCQNQPLFQTSGESFRQITFGQNRYRIPPYLSLFLS